ncbi:MAG: helix-turn-helix transcriptional regulator, partial [Spirochaetales bacterium]|nr:helix-turn-helix transcriptional regulator [Spirochaetales bacterium]
YAVMEARGKADITQKQLSELTGIDQSDISKIERGVANPSVSTLERIARALGGKLIIKIKM